MEMFSAMENGNRTFQYVCGLWTIEIHIINRKYDWCDCIPLLVNEDKKAKVLDNVVTSVVVYEYVIKTIF